MATLYITEPGSRLEKEYHHILVTSRDDELILRAPLVNISEIVLVGSVGVTTPALISLLEKGISLTILSATGRLLGRLRAETSGNIPLRHQQYQRSAEPAYCLEIGRAI